MQGAIYQNATDNSLRFNGYNNAEAARLDSSGNLLVGRTSSSGVDTDGHVLFNSGESYQSVTSNICNLLTETELMVIYYSYIKVVHTKVI